MMTSGILLLSYLFIISIGINLFMFIPAFLFKTDKLTDLSYSITFIVLILSAFLIDASLSLKLILALMVIAWALRLGIFLFIRIWNIKKDKRFDGIRESFLRFIKFWLLQGLAVWVILLPSLFFIIGDAKRVCWLGLFIWLSGLLIESTADFQKYLFNQNKKNKGKFISSGIWKYSRHPNYFGEISCWVGIYIFVFPSLSWLQAMIALISPLMIASLLIFITGLPPLEKYADVRWGKQKDYKEYKKKTSILIPWFRKR